MLSTAFVAPCWICPIFSPISRVGEAVAAISDALREQTTVSENVARSVEEIAQQAEGNLERARRAAAASEQMRAVAGLTKASVERFRL